MHCDADEPARPGPEQRVGVRPYRAREDVSASATFAVHSPLHGAEYPWAFLPLVQQHRLGPISKGGVRVCPERDCLPFVVEPDGSGCVA